MAMLSLVRELTLPRRFSCEVEPRCRPVLREAPVPAFERLAVLPVCWPDARLVPGALLPSRAEACWVVLSLADPPQRGCGLE